MTDTPTEPRRRRGGRRERPTGPAAPGQRPWQCYRRTIEPTKVVSDDELESIHLASLEVLRDTGMDFLHPRALKLWAEAGAKADGERVRFDPRREGIAPRRSPRRESLPTCARWREPDAPRRPALAESARHPIFGPGRPAPPGNLVAAATAVKRSPGRGGGGRTRPDSRNLPSDTP